MNSIGAFTFVLHSHLPYARLAGRWPHGEEWIHEAATETYIPLLETLYDLKQENIPFKLTIGITPTLAEQLADADVKAHLVQYLDERLAAAEADIALFKNDNAHLLSLAEYFHKEYTRVKDAFLNRFNQDLIGAFRTLQDEGYIDILTSAATHAYLPLLERDSTIRGQIATGMQTYRRLFGKEARGIWLPECAYRPAFKDDDGNTRVGFETFLDEYNLRYFFSETHSITGGQPSGVATGDIIGPYGEINRQYFLPDTAILDTPERTATTYQPYFVSDSTQPQSGKHSGVTVIGRNNELGKQVWSAEYGYPGDFDYREFHKKSGTSGLRYWRVTGDTVGLGEKDYYHPEWAQYKIEQHAEHFAHKVGDLLREYHDDTGEYGVISANYDAELFGHWWHEGVRWLGLVLRHLSSRPDIEIVTTEQFLEQHPPKYVLDLPESSWGMGGTHFVWNNAETFWMWKPIHEVEQRLERLAQQYETPTDDERTVLNQMAREALLLQSSDWEFLITTNQARQYAIQRFSQHLERFNQLAESLESGAPNVTYANELWELDKVFVDIDYRWFA